MTPLTNGDFVSHLTPSHYIDEATEREPALRHGLAHLRLADEVWVLSERIRQGMQGEIVEAWKLGIIAMDVRF